MLRLRILSSSEKKVRSNRNELKSGAQREKAEIYAEKYSENLKTVCLKMEETLVLLKENLFILIGDVGSGAKT